MRQVCIPDLEMALAKWRALDKRAQQAENRLNDAIADRLEARRQTISFEMQNEVADLRTAANAALVVVLEKLDIESRRK